MVLSKLLQGVTVTKLFQTMYGKMVVTHDAEVRNVHYDSRKIAQRDLFVAIRGVEFDGRKFVPDAISRGAIAVLMDDDTAYPDSFFMHSGVVKIVVPDSRAALAQIAGNFYNHPSHALQMIGVTGTNGKTTTTHLIKSILDTVGNTTGLIGTIEYTIGNEVIPATHTTPESLELNAILARMVQCHATAAVMEVSSHALHQHRVDGIQYRAAVFTNLTQDHLDYHGSIEEYFRTKKILFDRLSENAVAITNADDPWGMKIVSDTHAASTMSYGIENPTATVQASHLSLSMNGTRFAVRHQDGLVIQIDSPLIGRFNVSNLLAAYTTGFALGIEPAKLQAALSSASPVRGRFEPIRSDHGWTAIVDYAHTPDALEKALRAVHDVFSGKERGRIITVFGCGGNRDRTKRPTMARIAASLSDITIVTSDNPRTENPETIIDEVMTGIPAGAVVHRESDRRAAIRLAISMAHRNDVILVAGKGHEDYQILGNEKIHFSDHEVIEECRGLSA